MDNLQQLLHQNHFLLTIKVLDQLLQSAAAKKQLTDIKLLYNALQLQHLSDEIDWEKYDSEMTAIRRMFETLIGQLVSQNVTDDIINDFAISTPILTLTKQKEQFNELDDLFKKFAFTKVEIAFWDDIPPLHSYSIIVFDNTDLMDEDSAEKQAPLRHKQRRLRIERETMMNNLVRSTPSLFLHYGNQLSWVSLNRLRVHAANSKFALFARLKELVDFLDRIRA